MDHLWPCGYTQPAVALVNADNDPPAMRDMTTPTMSNHTEHENSFDNGGSIIVQPWEVDHIGPGGSTQPAVQLLVAETEVVETSQKYKCILCGFISEGVMYELYEHLEEQHGMENAEEAELEKCCVKVGEEEDRARGGSPLSPAGSPVSQKMRDVLTTNMSCNSQHGESFGNETSFNKHSSVASSHEAGADAYQRLVLDVEHASSPMQFNHRDEQSQQKYSNSASVDDYIIGRGVGPCPMLSDLPNVEPLVPEDGELVLEHTNNSPPSSLGFSVSRSNSNLALVAGGGAVDSSDVSIVSIVPGEKISYDLHELDDGEQQDTSNTVGTRNGVTSATSRDKFSPPSPLARVYTQEQELALLEAEVGKLSVSNSSVDGGDKQAGEEEEEMRGFCISDVLGPDGELEELGQPLAHSALEVGSTDGTKKQNKKQQTWLKHDISSGATCTALP